MFLQASLFRMCFVIKFCMFQDLLADFLSVDNVSIVHAYVEMFHLSCK